MISWIFKVLFFALLMIATQQSLVPKSAGVFEPIWDKYLHLVCWGILALTLYSAYRVSGLMYLRWLGLFLYSIVIEFGQIFVPGRMFSGEDVLANGLGILLAYTLIKFGEKYFPFLRPTLK
jgi:VanZ family protein